MRAQRLALFATACSLVLICTYAGQTNTHAFAMLAGPALPALRTQMSQDAGLQWRLNLAKSAFGACTPARTGSVRLMMMATDLREDNRLLASRRLAAAVDVIKEGVEESEQSKLLGSRRLAKVKDLMLKTPADQKRLLGSKRLKEARMILFNKAAQTQKAAEEEKKLLGSKRLNLVRQVLMKGAEEMQSTAAAAEATLKTESRAEPLYLSDAQRSLASMPPADPVAVQAPAAVKTTYKATPAEVLPSTGAKGPKISVGTPVTLNKNYKPTDKQVKDIATIRGYLAAMPPNEKVDMSAWLDNLEDVDIFRYLIGFGSADAAWDRIKATAKWRVAEKIDTILSEDLSTVFEEGKDEMIFLPPDTQCRPIILYRSALHVPGKIDPLIYTRFVTQQIERAVQQYQIGRTAEAVVLVDRIGSGLKNQDPALLRVLIPLFLNHYPYLVGAVYVAPTSGIFNVIWGLLKLLLTEDAQKRFVLIDSKSLTATLKKSIAEDVLPDNLGGLLDVNKWLAERKDLDKASAQLSELEELMTQTSDANSGGDSARQASLGTPRPPLAWAGKEASEQELLIIAAVRVNIAELSAAQKAELGPWLFALDNAEILRFIRRDLTPDKTWAALQATSKWRKEQRIDDITSETILLPDGRPVMPESGEEFYMTGLDKLQRPILVYRSSLHKPGRVDPLIYCRYVIKKLEVLRKTDGLGKTCQANIVVDRVGSSMGSQDPALLRELIPCFTTHFPGIVGNIYIAPTNTIFYAIWSLVSLLLDPVTRESVKLLNKNAVAPELLQVIDADKLPKNLGGTLPVPQAGIY